MQAFTLVELHPFIYLFILSDCKCICCDHGVLYLSMSTAVLVGVHMQYNPTHTVIPIYLELQGERCTVTGGGGRCGGWTS